MDLREKQMRVFSPGEDRKRRRRRDPRTAWTTRPTRALRHRSTSRPQDEIELVQRRRAAVRRGRIPGRPPDADVLRLGDQQLRRAARCSTRWSTWRRRRARAPAIQRVVQPDEPKFSGVVFKIQANMDPAHRDRIAFVRVASGHFERGMRLKVVRSGKELRPNTVVIVPVASAASCSTRPSPATSSASRTTACCSSATRSPKARRCSSPGCRSSRPRCSAASRWPTRCAPSSCKAGLTQLGEEGAIQVFRPVAGSGAAAGRGRAAAVRGGGAPARARIRLQGAHHAQPLPGRALGDLRRGRRRRRSCSASSTATPTASPTTRSTRRPCWWSTRPSCARSRANWPKIKFHALREHAGLVFQKRLEG